MIFYTLVYLFFRHLVKAGVLNVRDVGSWWIAIPGAGLFMKSFIRGRKASLTMIRKCKYKEILKRVSIMTSVLWLQLGDELALDR